jgi:DNA helicase-2/ATP-dependent DNA helicase PcrA
VAVLNRQYPEDQRYQAVIDHKKGLLAVLAGPGTGKTYSLILRIHELVEKRQIKPEQICYLTFIREIANTFEDDFRTKYPSSNNTPPPERLRISTLHGLACRLIRNIGYQINITSPPFFLNLIETDNAFCDVALKDLASLCNENSRGRSYTPTTVKDGLISIKRSWQKCTNLNLDHQTETIFKNYIAYSRSIKLLDWDEVIPLADSLLHRQSDMPTWLSILKHYLIDEYQDFNPAEQKFLSRLLVAADSATIVGDDCQSIYSSRGASREVMRQLFSAEHVDSVTFTFSRRCPSRITSSANAFLKYMKEKDRALKSYDTGGFIKICQLKSAKAEVDYLSAIVKPIMEECNTETKDEDNIICLFPRNRVLMQYKKDFETRGIKCRIRHRGVALDDRGWLSILLRLAVLKRQPFLERLVLTKFLDARKITLFLSEYVKQDKPAETLIERMTQLKGWGEKSESRVQSFVQFLENLTSSNEEKVTSCVNLLLASATLRPDEVRFFLEQTTEAEFEEKLGVLLHQVFDTPSDPTATETPSLELMTIHGSKGLTRRFVILPGLEQCWIPGSASGDQLEEFKRLFFVAISRTKEHLLITYPRSRARGDSLNYRQSGWHQLSVFAEQLGVSVDDVW